MNINDPRAQLVLAEAITFAIEGMSRLPDEHRPNSNIADLEKLLDDMSLSNLRLFQNEARTRVDLLLGNTPAA